MDYGKMTKGELISELKSLKSKLEYLENKKPEGELNKTVALMTNVINSTTDLIFVKDMKLRTIMCNKAFANAAGKKPEEMIGKTDIENGWDPELVSGNPEKGIPGFGNDDRQALKGNEIHRPMEPGNVGNDIRFFDTRKLPLRDVDGQIFGVLGISRDITERVQVEDELKKLFDLSLDMICIADITTSCFKRINPAFGKTLGYSDEELLGRPFTDFVHPDDRNPTIKVVEGMLSQGSDVINFENRYRCKDGSYKWLMWTSKTISEQGVAYAVARDITEKKLVEEELKRHRNQLKELVAERTIELTTTNKKLQFEIAERKQSEEKLQAIIDNSTAIIYLKDTHGRYIMINRLYETLFNTSKKEIIGKTDYDIFPEELAEVFQKNDRKVLTLGSPFQFEEIASHADGLHTYISLKFPLSNAENVIYGVCGISTDITDRRKMENELIKAQKFESIGVFAGGTVTQYSSQEI
jgi:PAS domain S-box-containing protein